MPECTGRLPRGRDRCRCRGLSSAIETSVRCKRSIVDIVKGNMGWIEVVVGPMFSGKSEELIRRLRRAEIARQRVQIFKPAIDERYAANEIISHSGLGIPSDNVTKAGEIMEKVQPRTEVIGIDEAQ